MNVILVGECVCPNCGTHNRAVQSSNVRILKNSLKTVGVSFGGVTRFCGECRHPMPPIPPERWTLGATDTAKVNAYRAKKGWDPV